MIESFVDLTYRGLPLGRRVKLTQVRADSGYLEMPAPMPVGTQILITPDDGPPIPAQVTALHEQVGGATHAPGMRVQPALADAAARTWWDARVVVEPPAVTDEPPSRDRPLTVRPRSQTVQTAPPEGAMEVPAGDVVAGGRTTVMDAVDPALIESLMGGGDGPAIVDDGRSTSVMDAVDPAALGLEIRDAPAEDPGSSSPSIGGGKKKKKKR